MMREKDPVLERLNLGEALIEKLRKQASEGASNAYAPYSNFPVGAAVLTSDGEVFSGCNVENVSYGLTVCAERNAIFQAVARGHRSIAAVVIVGGDGAPAPPCGACRQVMEEFGPKMTVISFSRQGERMMWDLPGLLPHPFSPANLKEPPRQR